MKLFLKTPMRIVVSCFAIVAGLLWLGLSRLHAGSPADAFRTPEEERTIWVYDRTNEAVVFITTTSLTVDPFDVFASSQPREGTGSGTIVDAARGIVLTNFHVIIDARKIEITLADGQNYRARLLGYDQDSDLAVLQIVDPPKELHAIPLGDSGRLRIGQRVLAIGNPFRLSRTLTSGIVSGLDRAVRGGNKNTIMKGLIQTDAAINPGNSGGPLIDMDGRLVGINTAILSQSGDSAGISFSVPVNHIRRVLPELIATGKVLRPQIGWILIPTNQGPFVRRVLPGSPAEAANVQPVERQVDSVFLQGYVLDFSRGDLITEVNGRAVQTVDEVEELVGLSRAGEPVVFTLRRGGPSGKARNVELRPVLR